MTASIGSTNETLNQSYSNDFDSWEAPTFLGCFELPVPLAVGRLQTIMCSCKSPIGRLESHQRGFWIETLLLCPGDLLSKSSKLTFSRASPGGSEDKASACNAGDPGLIPGLGRSPGEGNGNPLQYSCLENPMDRGAWWATVHGVTKSRTRLSDFTSLRKRWWWDSPS